VERPAPLDPVQLQYWCRAAGSLLLGPPPTAAEVERVKEQQRRETEVQQKQNGYWLSTMRTRVENGDPLETIGDYLTLVNGLTAEKLAAAAKKFLSEENRARFVLLPEKP
jgi:zinc protease